MKIVVIGRSDLIGDKLVPVLCQRGQKGPPASSQTDVNTLTAEGLPESLEGAQVAAGVANSLSSENTAVMSAFQASERDLLAAENGVRPHSPRCLGEAEGTDAVLPSVSSVALRSS